jgi:hypothetical protein
MYAKPLQILIGTSILTIGACAAAQDSSSPIVDVRLDEAFRDIPYSMGDEWAPTWARDDHLYTGNNDGYSFGGVPFNTIAFGKLEGDRPDRLKGTTINGMPEFNAQRRPGPEGALWKVK